MLRRTLFSRHSREGGNPSDLARSGSLLLATRLAIYTPTPEYLFAMKCMAMRAEGIERAHDISDIEALAQEAGIADAATALLLVEAFYPAARIPTKVRFGIEEIMENMAIRSANGAIKVKPDPFQN
jgi:hypothetical protein